MSPSWLIYHLRNGSALVRDVREHREKMKMRKRFWELGGSRMGDAMGIERPPEEGADGDAAAGPAAVQLGSSKGKTHEENLSQNVVFETIE
jgi:hypothetical protein